MNRFIRELRRREVLRTAGLYVGVSWILIEVASVLLPTFDAPDWIMRAIVIVAVVGFPVMLVLAWFYDVTDHGIEIQGDPTDTVVAAIGTRKMDFVVIGVLTVALVFSVYMNITSGPEVVGEQEPVSVLIADFDNQTGNPLFDGLVEQALAIGIESAPNVTSYQRNNALSLATRLQPGVETLNSAVAQLVAAREGIKMVLAGVISPDGSGFELELQAVDPITGETIFNVASDAKSPDAVLTAIGELSEEVREELGDTTLDDTDDRVAGTFTAASLEAARAYINGLQFAFEGNHEAAVDAYNEAIRLDPNFGRAYASLGLSARRVGMNDLSAEAWQKALSLLETMTERERLRSLGVYYASITRNYSSAIDNFSLLVEKYPADAPGHNNLAVVYFLTLDFANARREGEKLLEIYPNRQVFRSNYALYAMYATDFETARSEAQKVIEQDPSFYKGYLPQAIAALDSGDYEAAISAYESMASAGPRGASLANVGLADLNIYRGQFDVAVQLLEDGIAADLAAADKSAAARKYVMLAEAQIGRADNAAAVAALEQALELDSRDATKVSAAMVFLAAGEEERAMSIATDMSSQLQPQRRALGAMLEALLDIAHQRNAEAVDKLTAARDFADLWLVRLQLGKVYLQAGYAAEAMAEFDAAASRRGEASAIYLDDVPTWRYLSNLPYWQGRAQQELGMTTAALQSFEEFLTLRPEGHPLAEDARQRMQN